MTDAGPVMGARLEHAVGRLRRPMIGGVVVLAVLLPVVMRDSSFVLLVLSLMGIYFIVVTGLDILYGYSGQASLGQAAFYGIGAYSVAILSGLHGWSVWLTLLLGPAAAATVAIVIGFPSVRLVHHFLALVTIGLAEITRLTFLNASDVTLGFNGIGRIPRPAILDWQLTDPLSFYYLIMLLAAVGLIVKWNIGRSWWGRKFHGVRTNPRAAEAFGAALVPTRTIALALSAAYAALGGGLYASLVSYVSPGTFTFGLSTLFFTMMLIGGAGTVWGPLVGVVLLTFVNQFGQQFEIYQGIFYGLVILLVVTFLPRGVVGSLQDLYRDRVKQPARRGGRGARVVEDDG